MPNDYELRVHREWLGLLQPVGLVVSPPALANAQAVPDRAILREQNELLALVGASGAPTRGRKAAIRDFPAFTRNVLGWKATKLAGSEAGPALPDDLSVHLPEYHETLRPTFAVPGLKDDGAPWLMLVQVFSEAVDLDESAGTTERQWHASPQVRLERLLREAGVPVGLLTNGREIRLVYAPRGESSGYLTWPVYALCEVGGRPLLSALCMLLGSPRLFTLPKEQRLPTILRESRKYQNVVSTKLAKQVLEGLNDLLRGFQAANERMHGNLLDATVRDDPDHVYGGLLAVILRLVFILYAEERGVLSGSAAYVRNYSLTALFEKLRADAGRFPDTMDERYGAWCRLLALFRMIHDGAVGAGLRLPSRHGHLFDPDGWPFLEGRPFRVARVKGAPVDVPKVSDGVVLRVLEKLLLLDGDRLSYRALDVEQIGSVYENMMGFRLERATETSLGLGKEHVVVGLDSLLAVAPDERSKRLEKVANVEVTGAALNVLKKATSVDALMAALAKRISPLTPRPVPPDGLFLQPTDERRRSGSHYTPRELTEPIVRNTLRPVLEALGPDPTPDRLLDLKVCDPAMGSGAFLVEACRQLAEQLVRAYDRYGRPTDVPPDEDILLYAQRQVAQHCLYGVDKNPFAVDLGKLSLWLATLAKDHPFTFLDHAIRHGDSLVGLTRDQIASFHWEPQPQVPLLHTHVSKAIAKALTLREEIQRLSGSDDVVAKRQLLREADEALDDVRLIGDAAVACFFEHDKPKARAEARARREDEVVAWLGGDGYPGALRDAVSELRTGEKAVPAFHWEIEFPEAFGREKPGFDAIVGNPPFLGGSKISTLSSEEYSAFLAIFYKESRGKSDLVAYFFRRAFDIVRSGGTYGLVSTNTIREGDTRYTGLRWIRKHGGQIYSVTRRLAWPGEAAVVVSVVHVSKGSTAERPVLDDEPVDKITAYLLAFGPDDDPARLEANVSRAFSGVNPNGKGFIITRQKLDEIASIDANSREKVFPFLGSVEMNESPTADADRYIICFRDCDESFVMNYKPLYDHLYGTVRLQRMSSNEKRLRERWWLLSRPADDLGRALVSMDKVLVSGRVATRHTFTLQNSSIVFSDAVTVFIFDKYSAFALLQCQCHEHWARFQGSSFKDDPRYIPEDCFETFPFPANWESDPALEAAGQAYYDFRAALMVRHNEGLTKTYNRFHDRDHDGSGIAHRDPEEVMADIARLRELHAAMDRAVLHAYGWDDIPTACEFLLDYEEPEDDDDDGRPRKRKKPWRYRWPDAARDEVLARLLELNRVRAEEERAAGGKAKGGQGKKGGGPAPDSRQGSLL